MDAVRKLILDRAVDLETNLAELSRQLGKNHAYLQQFIRRGIPAKLPEDVRAQLATILNVPETDLKLLPKSNPRNNSVTIEAKSVRGKSANNGKNNRDQNDIIPGNLLIGDRDLPVFGSAQGGSGVLVVSSDPVEWVARPEPLAKVREGYGVIILEDSMSPEFEPGDIALVHPHLPPAPGATCIFRSHRADGTMVACIKRLRKVTASAWHVRQWNPPAGEKADYALNRSEWQECHVTVGRYTRR